MSTNVDKKRSRQKKTGAQRKGKLKQNRRAYIDGQVTSGEYIDVGLWRWDPNFARHTWRIFDVDVAQGVQLAFSFSWP